MKSKFIGFVGLVLSVLMSTATLASESENPVRDDYFVGKWSVVVKNTPNGDSEMMMEFKRVDGKLTGGLLIDKNSGEVKPFNAVEELRDGVKVYFTAEGYDVDVHLVKVDQDNVKGSLMNMFDAIGKRIK